MYICFLLLWSVAKIKCCVCTMAKIEIIPPKNVGAKVAMNSISMAINKFKILGAVLELPAKQHW